MPWQSYIVRSILLDTKRWTPVSRRIIRERKIEIVIFVILFLAYLLSRKWIVASLGTNRNYSIIPFAFSSLNIEEKDIVIPMMPAGFFLIVFMFCVSIRHLLEKRPNPLQTRRDVQALTKNLLKTETDAACTRVVRRIRLKPDRIVAPVDSLEFLKIMTRMNCELFMRSVHGQSYEAKLARNQAHVARNPNVIRLLGMRADDRLRIESLSPAEVANIPEIRTPWVGFSHILPISEPTYHAYVWPDEQSRIEDITFPTERICPVGTEAYAFLLFTVALDGPQIRRWEVPPLNGSNFLEGKNLRRERLVRAEQDLYLMVFDHLRVLAKIHSSNKRECRILAQAMLGTTEKILEALGFKELKETRTSDDERVYELVVRFE